MLPVRQGDHLHARSGQRLVGGKHVPVVCGDYAAAGIGPIDEHVVDIWGGGVLVHSHTRGGVGLGVEVAQQYPLSQRGQGGGEVDGGSGLAHASLLIDDSDDLGHGAPPESKWRTGVQQTSAELYYINRGNAFQLFFPFFRPGSEKRRRTAQGRPAARGEVQTEGESRDRACLQAIWLRQAMGRKGEIGKENVSRETFLPNGLGNTDGEQDLSILILAVTAGIHPGRPH